MEVEKGITDPTIYKFEWSADLIIKIPEEDPLTLLNSVVKTQDLSKSPQLTHSSILLQAQSVSIAVQYENIMCLGKNKDATLIMVKSNIEQQQQWDDSEDSQESIKDQLHPFLIKVKEAISQNKNQSSRVPPLIIDFQCQIQINPKVLTLREEIYKCLSEQIDALQKVRDNSSVLNHKSQLMEMLSGEAFDIADMKEQNQQEIQAELQDEYEQLDAEQMEQIRQQVIMEDEKDV